MVSQLLGALTPQWIARYLARVDHAKALKFIANWPASSPIYHAAWFCEQFTYLEQEFGYDCVEAFAPAIAGRLRADPIDRKSVGEGKRASVRVELGGRRRLKKKIEKK